VSAFLIFTAGFSFFSVGPITPLIIESYGISHTTAGLLTSLVALVHGGFAIPASMLVSRVGLKNLITLGALAGAAPALTFLATDSFLFLLGTRAAYGLGLTILFPAAAPLFMQWFRPKELALVNGLFVTSASLGIATSTFVVAPLSEAIGWESTLSAFGGLSLASAVVWIAFGKVPPRVERTEGHSSLDRLWDALRSRSTVLLILGHAGPFSLLTVALAWLPTFYNEAHGISLQKAGAVMGLLSLAGVFALVLASLLTVRVSRRRPFLIIPGILAGFAGFASFLLADSIAVYFAVVALGFACWFYLPALLTIPMELYPADPQRVSVIYGILISVEGTATFVAALSVGALFDVTGSFLPGLALFSILAWSLAVGGFLLPETGTARTEPLVGTT
jgi:CP family cyanate transporter-like MFS transporter